MKNSSNLITRLKSVIILVPLIWLLPVCTVLADTMTGQVRPLQLMDVFDLEYAANPGFSPDGRHIIYERRFMDVMNDRARGNLWQIDVRNGSQNPLVTGLVNASQPAFSPDGKFLAYVSNESGQSRLYLRWRDSSDSIVVTQRSNPVSNPVFSPDSRWIAFTSRVDEAASSYASMPEKPRGAQWAEPARVIDRPVYRFDGAGFLPRGYQQVFVVPATGGTARQITHGQRNHNSALAYSDDGKSLLLSANMTADPYFNPANSDIIRVDIASGEITQLTDRDVTGQQSCHFP